jgi:hypothetical protein
MQIGKPLVEKLVAELEGNVVPGIMQIPSVVVEELTNKQISQSLNVVFKNMTNDNPTFIGTTLPIKNLITKH